MSIIKPKQSKFDYSNYADTGVDKGRFRIEIPITLKLANGTEFVTQAVIDTGAESTIIAGSMIGITYALAKSLDILRAKYYYLGATGGPITCHLTEFNELRFGRFILRGPLFNVSFDDNMQFNVIGMDVIGAYQTLISPDKRLITFRETLELARFRPDIKPVNIMGEFCKDTVIEFGQEELEAQAVREMINEPIFRG